MKRENRPELSVSCRDMTCVMSASNAIYSAVRISNALRFNFFGFWFTKILIRES